MKKIDFKKIKNFYLLGIGGIGMSALARYFKYKGKNVIGYDKKKTYLTSQMEKEGIEISYKDKINDKKFKNLKYENTVIVYTSALSKKNKQIKYFKNKLYVIKKRSEILGLITKNKFCIAIAGTHGKTTISALLSHILYVSGKKITAFIGGIAKNYNSNIIIKGEKILIVEADEYDKSFLKLFPNIICINSIDPDHLEIYKNEKKLIEVYKKFAKKISEKNNIFIKKGIKLCKSKKYAINEKSDYYSNNLKLDKNKWIFDFNYKKKKIKKLILPIPGEHNLENVTAAITIALKMKTSHKIINKALKSFKGIERRYSIEYNSNKKIYIDDYAHHPTEIKALIKAVKKEYNNKKVLGIFQPHLFSRTKIFESDFIKALEMLDSLILTDIYAARESLNKKISSKKMFKKIKIKEKKFCNLKNVIEEIKKKKFDILLTIGAGNINKLVNPIKFLLKSYFNE